LTAARVRAITLFLATLLTVAALGLALRTAPRLVLSNAGLLVHTAPAVYVSALLAALLWAGSALALREWRRGAAAIVAVGMLWLGLSQWVWRLEAGPEGLSERRLHGTRAIAWWDVTRVDAAQGALLFTVHAGGSLRIATDTFTDDQRAALERTVSRLVRNAQGAR
jgi:hypothetical protein